MMRRVVGFLGVAFLALVLVCLWRTLQFGVEPEPLDAAAEPIAWDPQAVERLAGALRHATVSNKDVEQVDEATFSELQAYLAEQFPRVFSQVPVEVVNGHSLLFRWAGSDESAEPILLLAHQDVVPVIPGTESEWTYPPFAGTVADGYIWGRGAVDDKASVVGILEAAERLLAEGFVPPRSIYFAFGHDEEVGGGRGAVAMANLLAERGERMAFLLDEGGVIARGMIPGIERPVALIGPGEKGYVSLELAARGTGGHSSMPPKHTAVGKVARALTRLEAEPFPADLALTEEFIRHLGKDQPFIQRMVFANLWLFSPLAEHILSSDHLTNAGIRTTTAATMMQGSVQDNVLPIKASAVVNFRIYPGETVDSVIANVQRIIADSDISVSPVADSFGSNPSSVAATTSPGFRVLSEVVREVRPQALVAPRLVVAATDARHYEQIVDNSYRFVGVEVTPREVSGVHGTDERVSAKSYLDAVRIYYRLMQRSGEL